jgi:excisionase family DNA binding protein
MQPTDPLLTVAETAELTHLSHRTIARAVRDGSLAVVRVRRCIRFRKADIDAFITQNRTPSSSAAEGAADA